MWLPPRAETFSVPKGKTLTLSTGNTSEFVRVATASPICVGPERSRVLDGRGTQSLQGFEIPPRERQTPEALAAYQAAEIDRWWPIIKAAGVKAE